MIFEEKTIILKDGRTAILKSPCVEDAEKLLNYIKTVSYTHLVVKLIFLHAIPKNGQQLSGKRKHG